jgi:hypothetical protein
MCFVNKLNASSKGRFTVTNFLTVIALYFTGGILVENM